MAIDTNNKKLALIMLELPFQPNLPLSPSTLGTDDQQQLLWGYPGIAWGAPPVGGGGSGEAARMLLLGVGGPV